MLSRREKLNQLVRTFVVTGTAGRGIITSHLQRKARSLQVDTAE